MCLRHDWSLWSKVSDTAFTYVKRQFRRCNVCGKTVSRTINLEESSVPAEKINELVK